MKYLIFFFFSLIKRIFTIYDTMHNNNKLKYRFTLGEDYPVTRYLFIPIGYIFKYIVCI